MAAVTKLKLDSEPLAQVNWQLLKPLQIVQTILTAANLTTPLEDVVFTEAFQVIEVQKFKAIRVGLWCIGANDETAVLQLYGWQHNGPGHHIATLGVILGNFTSAANTGFHASTNTHKNIRDVYAAGTAYRGVDTFSITAQYGATQAGTVTAVLLQGTMEADFPAYFQVNFERRRYKYFGIMATTVPVTAGQVGAIFRPVDFVYD